MTIWSPTLAEEGPYYRALADAIERDVRLGVLAPGARLPTQRALADRLGLAVATVTRAYAEASKLGLISSEIGRGTFVRAGDPAAEAPAVIDLRGNWLLPWPMLDELRRGIARVAGRAGEGALGYGPHGGSVRHRAAGLRLAREAGVPAALEQVLVTAGAQHAMAVVLGSLLAPGDVVIVEVQTYSGMRSLASLLRLRLRPVAMDAEGLRPDALRAALAEGGARALYAIPVLQNPTAAVMGRERRDEVAEIARGAGLLVVEDDSYGFLLPEAPRLAEVLPEAVWLTGTSKALLPALRVGFLRAPAELVPRLEAAIGASIYLASPLLAEVVAEWVDDGTAARVVGWKREEVAARREIADRVLAGFELGAHPRSPHLWLRLPEPWQASEAVEAAERQGVLVTPAEAFSIERDAPRAVRACLGPPAARDHLEAALGKLAVLYSEPPVPPAIVA
jgi:DNA-binding transcriptional MocR family regulator